MYVFCNAVTDCYDGSDEDLAVCEGGKKLNKIYIFPSISKGNTLSCNAQ